MGGDEALDDVELLEGPPGRLRLGQVGRHPDRPELAAHAALAEARDVRHLALDRPAQVDRGDSQPGPLAELLGQVVVAVDQGCATQDLTDLLDLLRPISHGRIVPAAEVRLRRRPGSCQRPRLRSRRPSPAA